MAAMLRFEPVGSLRINRRERVGYGRPREGAPGQFETFDVPMKIVDNRDQAAGVRSERRPARTATSQCATRHGRYRAVESLVSSLPSSPEICSDLVYGGVEAGD
jgi:hypothetical protein